jgi:hypothetical protein
MQDLTDHIGSIFPFSSSTLLAVKKTKPDDLEKCEAWLLAVFSKI